MRARKEIRQKADLEKQEIVAQFEKMKRKGKMDYKVLAKLGLDTVTTTGHHSSTTSSP